MSENSKPKRRRIPNLRRLLASEEPVIVEATEEAIAMGRLIEILAKVPPDKRGNVLRAVSILHGIEL